MQVSVVLAVYNEENWMRTCLDSLMNQTIPFELIVVDNGSVDASVQVAQEYTSLVFSSEKGKLNARNLGVQEASGDVVVMNFFLFYSPGSATAYRTGAFLMAGGYKPVRQPTFTSVAWEELFRFSASITRFGWRIWEPKAYCIHYRPRELCVACMVNGDSTLSVFCKEIETGQRF